MTKQSSSTLTLNRGPASSVPATQPPQTQMSEADKAALQEFQQISSQSTDQAVTDVTVVTVEQESAPATSDEPTPPAPPVAPINGDVSENVEGGIPPDEPRIELGRGEFVCIMSVSLPDGRFVMAGSELPGDHGMSDERMVELIDMQAIVHYKDLMV